MKFYLTGPSGDREFCNAVIRRLEQRGWECVYSWAAAPPDMPAGAAAELCEMGVKLAQLVIVLNPGYGGPHHQGAIGSWIEFGMARVLRRPLVLVDLEHGQQDHPFFAVAARRIRYAEWHERLTPAVPAHRLAEAVRDQVMRMVYTGALAPHPHGVRDSLVPEELA